MHKRPILNIEKDNNDKKIELLTLIILILTFIVSIIFYFNVDSEIPIHFNFIGDVDSYGDKIFLLVLPLISLFIFLPLNWLKNKPHLFNYTKKITEENYKYEYIKAFKLVSWVLLITVSMFFVAVIEVITEFFNYNESINIPFIILILLILSIFYKMFKYLIK